MRHEQVVAWGRWTLGYAARQKRAATAARREGRVAAAEHLEELAALNRRSAAVTLQRALARGPKQEAVAPRGPRIEEQARRLAAAGLARSDDFELQALALRSPRMDEAR